LPRVRNCYKDQVPNFHLSSKHSISPIYVCYSLVHYYYYLLWNTRTKKASCLTTWHMSVKRVTNPVGQRTPRAYNANLNT
jgi:hypothetical protein